jgi:hypothetical protein
VFFVFDQMFAGSEDLRPLPLADQRGLAPIGVTLEELFFALDPHGHADHRARPTFDVLDQPVANGFVVAGEIEFGDRLIVMGIGPEPSVGV